MKRYLPSDEVIVQTARSYDIGDFLLCDIDVKQIPPRREARQECHLSYHLASRTVPLETDSVEVDGSPRTVVYGLDGHLCLTDERCDLYLIHSDFNLTGEKCPQSIKILWSKSLYPHRISDVYIPRILFEVAKFLSARAKDLPSDPPRLEAFQAFMLAESLLTTPTIPSRQQLSPHDICQAFAAIIKTLDPLECHIELDLRANAEAPKVGLSIVKTRPVLGAVGKTETLVYDAWI